MSRTQEQIAVMQASLEGKRVEAMALPQGDWKPFDPELGWNWQHFDYRLIPARPEPAEPRTWELAVSPLVNSSMFIASSKPGSADRTMSEANGWSFIRVTEIPPGWKLVPPVAGRPPLEGATKPPDGFEYWGVGPLTHRPDDDDEFDCAFMGISGDSWTVGGQGCYDTYHYAIRRNTALHAANFGEVPG